jgi:nucleoside phosphorylase
MSAAEMDFWPASVSRESFLKLIDDLEKVLSDLSLILKKASLLIMSVGVTNKLKAVHFQVARHIEEIREHLGNVKLLELEGNFSNADKVASEAIYLSLRVSALLPSPCNSMDAALPDESQCLAGIFQECARKYDGLRRLCTGEQSELVIIGDLLDKLIDFVKNIQCGTKEIPSIKATKKPIGVITALPHEYQSILRRLDSIVVSTSSTSQGFQILHRESQSEDPRKKSIFIIDPENHFGWAVGYFGDQSVLVVCAGVAGGEASNSAVNALFDYKLHRQYLKYDPRRWLVVGVCAGSNKQWLLGQPLLSNKLFKMEIQTAKYRWGRLGFLESLELSKIPLFRKKLWFRPEPTLTEASVLMTSSEIMIEKVDFLCCNVVVNDDIARENLLASASQSIEEFREQENNYCRNFGIEMEGVGSLPITHERLIVKAVCDYADSAKGGVWKDDMKNIVQLYAAEAAAEAALAIIPHLPIGFSSDEQFQT